MIIPLLLLSIINIGHSFISSPHRSTNTKSLTTLRVSPILINLADTYEINNFIDTFTGSELKGVFVGFSAKGKLITSDYSMDIVKTASLWKRDIKSIKVQTFADSNEVRMKTYLDALLKELSSTTDTEKIEPENDVAAIVSPFESSSSGVSNNQGSSDDDDDDESEKGLLKLTISNVDDVLEEVRPYLIADGGNVKVVRVDEVNQVIDLALQGACGSCPSSTTTMKMGIERVLKENFPFLKEVRSVTEDAVKTLTRESIEAAIAKISPAIKALKGSVEVLDVAADTGVVSIRFSGPAKLEQGVELVIKDVPLVTKVIILNSTSPSKDVQA